MSDTVAFLKTVVDIILVSSMILVLGLFITCYHPPELQPESGDCIKYREAAHQSLFASSVECVEWKK